MDQYWGEGHRLAGQTVVSSVIRHFVGISPTGIGSKLLDWSRACSEWTNHQTGSGVRFLGVSLSNRLRSLLGTPRFRRNKRFKILQNAIAEVRDLTNSEIRCLNAKLNELRGETNHGLQDLCSEVSQFRGYAMGELERTNVELNKLRAQVNDELPLLSEQTTRVHNVVTERTAYLEGELSRLHAVVVERFAVQLRFLNQQIFQLKSTLYHSQWMPDPQAFNGQFSKQRIFEELCSVFSFDNFVETGCHLGSTSEFLARVGKPVYAIEIEPVFYERARELLSTQSNICFLLGDSSVILENLARETLLRSDLTFFYLDAHWRDHLPLRDELRVIGAQHSHGVVMLDDIKVEGDSGYGYDSYDKGQEISLKFLREELRDKGWQVFFPTLPSTQDHIQIDVLRPRGTAVISCEQEITATLMQVKSLRHWHFGF